MISVRDRQGIGKLPILIHEVELIPRQKHCQNQLHFQLGHLHPHTRVPTGSPAKEWIGSVGNGVRSQPSAGVVLFWFRVVFGVQVDISHRIHEEISPSDHLFADFQLLMNVSSESDTIKGDPMGLPDTGIEDRELVFPSGDRDSSELLT